MFCAFWPGFCAVCGPFFSWLTGWAFPRRQRRSRRSGSHGTARFATWREILWNGALFGHGPVLGKGVFGSLLRFTRDGPVMVFAANGAGKGLGVVVPTLLDYPGSMLVTDPKGENYAVTHRRRANFGTVRMLNPSDLARSERFNPLDIIRVGTDFEADDAGVLARYMVRPDAGEAHWDDKAVSLLTALILHTLAEPPETRTLAHVRSLSIGGSHTVRDTLMEIATASRSLKAAEIASGFLGALRRTPTRGQASSRVSSRTCRRQQRSGRQAPRWPTVQPFELLARGAGDRRHHRLPLR